MTTVSDDVLGPRIFTAAHVGNEFNGIMREFRQAVALDGAQHIEYYEHGLPAVSADLLHHPRLAPFSGSRTVDRARRDYETIGRQLNHRMTELNASLAGLASGRLIRTVFAAEDRAVLYFDVDEGQYLVGISLGADAIDKADQALCDTATRIRAARGASDPSYGGQRPGAPGAGSAGSTPAPSSPVRPPMASSGDESDLDEPSDSHSFASLPRPSAPVFANPWASLIERRWSPSRDEREDAFQAQAASILQPADLQYVALVRGGLVSSADLLDHGDLDDFFVGPSRNSRREGFAKVAGEFLALSDLLDGLLRSVLNRRLTRTVLDVEKGALYIHRLGREEFLLGVTLDHRQVATADQRFQLLVHRMTGRSGA